MTKYANRTQVSVDKSIQEIRNLLTKYDATKFGYIEESTGVILAFEMLKLRIRFFLPMPKTSSSPTQKERMKNEQENRRLWRALLLVIKSKLESIESGIETFEEAFMSHIVMPNNQTMGQLAIPQIRESYETGKTPPLLGEIK